MSFRDSWNSGRSIVSLKSEETMIVDDPEETHRYKKYFYHFFKEKF